MEDKTNECCIQTNAINVFSVLHGRHSSTKRLPFFKIIPQLLHIALTWSMSYLKPSANIFFSPVRSHVSAASSVSSLSASKCPRSVFSCGNCTMPGEEEPQISVFEPFQHSLLTYYCHNAELFFFNHSSALSTAAQIFGFVTPETFEYDLRCRF